MRKKLFLILVLCAIAFVSLTVGTLSNYTSVTSFGTTIYPDLHKINNH